MPIDTDAMMAYVREHLERGGPSLSNGVTAWRQNGSARWEHTCRVLATAQRIAHAENADDAVLTVAAIFHDVAKFESTAEEHAARGAEIAAEYLIHAGAPEAWVKRVCAAIVNHTRADSCGFSLEDRVLRDADLLDETGALGVLWTAMNAGRADAPSYADVRARIDKFDRQGAARVIELMLTRAGRAMAEQRLAFVNAFLAGLDEECGVRD